MPLALNRSCGKCKWGKGDVGIDNYSHWVLQVDLQQRQKSIGGGLERRGLGTRTGNFGSSSRNLFGQTGLTATSGGFGQSSFFGANMTTNRDSLFADNLLLTAQNMHNNFHTSDAQHNVLASSSATRGAGGRGGPRGPPNKSVKSSLSQSAAGFGRT